MSAKHTPGPWINVGHEIVGPVNSGVLVARIPDWGLLSHIEDPRWANGRLIAAAPELLDALQSFVKYATDCDDDSPELDKARAAIAKATGVSA